MTNNKENKTITDEQVEYNKLAQYIAFCDIRECPEWHNSTINHKGCIDCYKKHKERFKGRPEFNYEKD